MPDIFPHYAGAMLTCGKGSKTLRYLIGFWGEYRYAIIEPGEIFPQTVFIRPFLVRVIQPL